MDEIPFRLATEKRQTILMDKQIEENNGNNKHQQLKK